MKKIFKMHNIEKLLEILRLEDVETLNALLEEDYYDPIGCGCCSYSPTPWYSSWDRNGNPYNKPKSSYKYISNGTIRLNPDYEKDI